MSDVATGSISCAGGDEDEPYNLAYAIGSVFAVLVVSFFGFITPILISDVGSKRGAKLAIVSCGTAGTSVIIAVAFHILGDGTTLLLNPCLVRALSSATRTAYPHSLALARWPVGGIPGRISILGPAFRGHHGATGDAHRLHAAALAGAIGQETGGGGALSGRQRPR